MRHNGLFLCTIFLAACMSERTPTGIARASLQAPVQSGQSDFVVTDLGTLGGSWSYAGWEGAINSSGQVVGQSETATGEHHAFFWDGHVMIDIGHAGEWSQALGINDNGQVIGLTYHDCGLGCPDSYHGFLWDHGVTTDLGMLPIAINNVGQIIGYSGRKGFLWDQGVNVDLGNLTLPLAINNAGQIVGSGDSGNDIHAFLWEGGVTTDLGSLGGSRTQARGINNRGQIVGGSTTAAGEARGFLWEGGVMTDLGTLGGTRTTVVPGDIIPGGINDRGQIAGVSTTESGDQHAFVWDRGVMTDVGATSVGWAVNNVGEMIGTVADEHADYHVFAWANGVMTVLPDLGPGGGWPAGINDAGQIAGSSGGHAVIWRRRSSARR